MDKFFCRKCNGTGVFMQQKGMQVGLYCDSCGAWFKWLSKKEQPIYKNRGLKLYPQNVEVTLKGTQSLGIEIISVDSNLEKNMGVVEENKKAIPTDDVPFGMNPKKGSESVDIEQEIERRVQQRLNEIEKQIKKKNMGLIENNENNDNYCPICDGSPLIPEEGNKVEVSIFSGVMTVTDIDGVEILGLYRLKKCPSCGKMF